MIQIVAAKGERGFMPEQLALKLLRNFRGLYKGWAVTAKVSIGDKMCQMKKMPIWGSHPSTDDGSCSLGRPDRCTG